MTQKLRVLILAFVAVVATLIVAVPVLAAAPSGAIFTSTLGPDNVHCSGVDLNIYGNKDAVYLNGGPAHPGAAGLDDGYYYVQVTEPDGTLLGTSVGSGNEMPVHVTNGEFDQCYKLSEILIKNSDGTPGYDDTSNSGGEYKAWVSTDSTFTNSNTKTDNFKVKEGGDNPDNQATLHVRKYYDANADGQYTAGETYLTGWKFRIHDNIDWIRYTPADMILEAPDDYWVSEFKPIETNWIATDAGTEQDPVYNTQAKKYSLQGQDDVTAKFGNVCVGAGGGLTLGFWSNNNGLAAMKATPGGLDAQLIFLRSLNLVQNDKKSSGYAFDPTTSKQFQTWLLKADSTNMAYMLSAQLAAMELNVRSGKVSGDALIYAPGTTSANALGFATVNSVMTEANTDLGAYPTTVKAGPLRTHQEALKIALDKGNNNLNFVQSQPCPFNFAN